MRLHGTCRDSQGICHFFVGEAPGDEPKDRPLLGGEDGGGWARSAGEQRNEGRHGGGREGAVAGARAEEIDAGRVGKRGALGARFPKSDCNISYLEEVAPGICAAAAVMGPDPPRDRPIGDPLVGEEPRADGGVEVDAAPGDAIQRSRRHPNAIGDRDAAEIVEERGPLKRGVLGACARDEGGDGPRVPKEDRTLGVGEVGKYLASTLPVANHRPRASELGKARHERLPERLDGQGRHEPHRTAPSPRTWATSAGSS